MKTILITGGASGFGKGVAMHYLKAGERVIAVGSSKSNGDIFLNEAKKLDATDRAFYIQADLSLVKENQRAVEELRERFQSLDMLIFCATKHSKKYIETQEGLEFTFALDYLSRFILSYGLKVCLEKTDCPVILNVCGSGMKGTVNWNDLQHKNSFEALKVMMHGSRLNDLSGVSFVQNDTTSKIKYIMYNPWAVKTPGMEAFGSSVTKLIYKVIGKSVNQAAMIIVKLLDNPPDTNLSAYREHKKLNLSHASYNPENAQRLYSITAKLLNDFAIKKQYKEMKQVNKIVPNIWFNSDEGKISNIIAYYKNIFSNDFQEGEIIPLGETPSGNTEMCEVHIFSQKYVLMSTAKKHHPLNDSISFMIHCEDQNEIDKYWNCFTLDGEESQCGWCTDKYGLRWQVLPWNLEEMMNKPNSLEVMMKQKKIVIAEYLE